MITKEQIATLFQNAEECASDDFAAYATTHKVGGALVVCYTEILIMGADAMNNAYFLIKYPKSRTWVWFRMSNCVKNAHFWHAGSYSAKTGKAKKSAHIGVRETDRLRSFIGKTTGRIINDNDCKL